MPLFIEKAPYPVKAMIFVNYNSLEPFIFEKVNKKEALQFLLKETWVNPVPEMIIHFFDWIEKTSFYKLQYSQTRQAIEVVKSLYQ